MNTVQVTVANSSEWQIPMPMEMLVNKNRRYRIDPELIYDVTGLEADKHYKMGITMNRVGTHKYRYKSMGWVQQSRAEACPEPQTFLIHTNGVMTGEQWMRTGVNFNYLVVSNTLGVRNHDELFVEPLHLYQPCLEIMCVEDPLNPHSVEIPEQQFIAVTKHSEMFKNVIKPQRKERKRTLKGTGMERSAKRSRHEPEDVVQEPVFFEEVQQDHHQMEAQEMDQEQYQGEVNNFETQNNQQHFPIQNFGQQPIREQYQRGLHQMEYDQASVQGQFAPVFPHCAHHNSQQQQYPQEQTFRREQHQFVQNVQVINFETLNDHQVNYRNIPVQNIGQNPIYEQQQQGCHQIEYGQVPIQGHYGPAHHGQQQEQYPQEIQHVHPTEHGYALIQEQVDPIFDQNVGADQYQLQMAVPEVENQENVAPEIEREEPVFDAEFFDNDESWNFNKNAPRQEHNNNLNVPLWNEEN